jgi:magnesium-protoporphyrin O-methyltransferase
MTHASYQRRRGELEIYFDRTAVDAWARLTSAAPVGKIRATVRAGRDAMRHTLLSWLPSTLRSAAVLDAGCGTGALSVEMARRGALVTAIDLSATLIGLARERLPPQLGSGTIDFCVGDMFDPTFGKFDHVLAMDSLIHYDMPDMLRVLSGFASRTRRSIIFTFAPKTPALALMWTVGRLFPRSNRAPALEPVSEQALRNAIASEPLLMGWGIGRTQRVTSGFYKSHAMELVRP